ncbi:MAG: hypothetical protein ACYCST_19500 [Acidimicrobiales bacterium]
MLETIGHKRPGRKRVLVRAENASPDRGSKTEVDETIGRFRRAFDPTARDGEAAHITVVTPLAPLAPSRSSTDTRRSPRRCGARAGQAAC